MSVDARTLARAQGAYNLVTGVWPLVHMRSFEAVSGPKVDTWLVRTVAGLLVTVAAVQLRAAGSQADARELGAARELGIGTALTLALIDLRYGVPGRIRRIYVAEAVVEAAFVLGWLRRTGNHPKGSLKGTAHPAEA